MNLTRLRAMAHPLAFIAMAMAVLTPDFPGAASAVAHDFQLKSLKIGHPYARATPPGAATAGAFMKIENQGKDADRLLGVASPAAAIVEVHEMSMAGGEIGRAHV